MSPDNISRSSKLVVIIFCCLVAMLDGADTQALGIAAPLMARDLNIALSELGLIFSAALAGASLGAFTGGTLADRFGAKRILVMCVFLFGTLHLATAHAQDITSLILMRFVAGLGLGGATPCFMGLALANVSPESRARVGGIVWAFFPAGALVGGLVNGWIVDNWTWREVFTVGGVATIAVAALLAVAVRDVAPSPADQAPRGTPSLLFVDATLRRRTIMLCTLFFGVFATLAAVAVWTPSLLVSAGFTPGQGGVALAWHALGALSSIAAGGFIFDRLGGRTVPIGLVTGAILVAALGMNISNFPVAMVVLVLIGLFLGIAVAGSFALCSGLLPNETRSTGLGFAMAAGRFGQMMLPYFIGLALSGGWTPALVFQLTAILPLLSAFAGWRLSRLYATTPGAMRTES